MRTIPPELAHPYPFPPESVSLIHLVPSSSPLTLSIVPFKLTSVVRPYPVCDCLLCSRGEGGGTCKIVNHWAKGCSSPKPSNPFFVISTTGARSPLGFRLSTDRCGRLPASSPSWPGGEVCGGIEIRLLSCGPFAGSQAHNPASQSCFEASFPQSYWHLRVTFPTSSRHTACTSNSC